MAKSTPTPRAVALELLDAVLLRKQPLDEALAANPAIMRLEPRDRAFTRNLVGTCLRRLGQIDAAIGGLLESVLPKKAEAARQILRLGAAQILFLRTPPHAAVDTAVRLAQQTNQGPYKKLINAVLRRLAREGDAITAAQDAARLNTPDWLWESWAAAYGEPLARAIANAHLPEPPLDLAGKDGLAAWAERLDGRIMPGGGLRLTRAGDVTALAGFDEGAWWVQDAAAQLPVRLLGDVAGKEVVDLCAAPGGKTMQLAALGASVTAIDRSARRLERVAENLARTGLTATLTAVPAEDYAPVRPPRAILLDAPCTSTGTLRRHPDAAWLKTSGDVGRLAAVQARLLDAAWQMLAPGGVLVFCTCSLQLEEGPAQIAGRPGFAPVMPGELAGLDETLITGGALRTLPCHLAELGGMDGFFAARFRKPF